MNFEKYRFKPFVLLFGWVHSVLSHETFIILLLLRLPYHYVNMLCKNVPLVPNFFPIMFTVLCIYSMSNTKPSFYYYTSIHSSPSLMWLTHSKLIGQFFVVASVVAKTTDHTSFLVSPLPLFSPFMATS